MRRNPFRRAFTLIELLLVLVILAVLAAVVVPNLLGRGEEAKRKAAIVDVSQLKSAIETFEVDNQRLPTKEEGLSALVICPQDLTSSWKQGGYLGKPILPVDPWGTAYDYEVPGPSMNGSVTAFNIISAGKDKQPGTDDDIDIYTEK